MTETCDVERQWVSSDQLDIGERWRTMLHVGFLMIMKSHLLPILDSLHLVRKEVFAQFAIHPEKDRKGLVEKSETDEAPERAKCFSGVPFFDMLWMFWNKFLPLRSSVCKKREGRNEHLEQSLCNRAAEMCLHQSLTVQSQIFVRYLISYFRTFGEVRNLIPDENLFLSWGHRISM